MTALPCHWRFCRCSSFYLTFITAPAALFIAIRYWKAPRSLVHRSQIRLVLAMIFASLQDLPAGHGALFHESPLIELMAAREYHRLTRALPRPVRPHFGGSTSLWLGKDHLLSIDSTGYTESYKRFYFAIFRRSFFEKPRDKSGSALFGGAGWDCSFSGGIR